MVLFKEVGESKIYHLAPPPVPAGPVSDVQNIKFEKKNLIAYITIDRPKVLNALNMATMQELKEEQRPGIGAFGTGSILFTFRHFVDHYIYNSLIFAKNFGRLSSARTNPSIH